MFNVTPGKLKDLFFQSRFYINTLIAEDSKKQSIFKKIHTREDWIEAVAADLTPADIRRVIKCEDELVACKDFERIFPTFETHKYFGYFKTVSYYDKLMDGVEHVCGINSGSRAWVVRKLEKKTVLQTCPPTSS